MRRSHLVFTVVLIGPILSVVMLTLPSADARVGMMRIELPTDWPESVRALWRDSLTIDISHGISEKAYEISFDDRYTFEETWPHVLELLDEGATITLESGTSYYARSGTTLTGPSVRILTPSGHTGKIRLRDGGQWVEIGPPWPDYVSSADGEMPEYVTLSDKSALFGATAQSPIWTPWQPGGSRESRAFRSRVDIILVVDSDIIDLNRIKFPPDTPIVDNRQPSETERARE